jgi:hypothetical protein
MSEEKREKEEIRREQLEAGVGDIVPGAGRRGKSRRMAQMVSVRLDGELVGKLRIVAKERNVTLSDLLREGAELIVEDEHSSWQTRARFKIFGAKKASPETITGRVLTPH